jgi:hypothetical protein
MYCDVHHQQEPCTECISSPIGDYPEGLEVLLTSIVNTQSEIVKRLKEHERKLEYLKSRTED